MFLKFPQNSQEHTCARVSLLIKLQSTGRSKANFVKNVDIQIFSKWHINFYWRYLNWKKSKSLLVINWNASNKIFFGEKSWCAINTGFHETAAFFEVLCIKKLPKLHWKTFMPYSLFHPTVSKFVKTRPRQRSFPETTFFIEYLANCSSPTKLTYLLYQLI